MAASGPLAGLRVAVTRPPQQAGALRDPLEALGAVTRSFPVIEIAPPADPAPLRRAIAGLTRFDWVVFTSANAVRAVVRELGLDRLHRLRESRIAVVGPATEAALGTVGAVAAVRAARAFGEALAPAMAGEADVAHTHVLWPRAESAREGLADALTALGAIVHPVVAYRTVSNASQAAALAAAVRDREVDVITFTSPSTVHAFTAAGGRVPPGVSVAAIGPVTARAARNAGLPVHIVPTEASADQLAAAIHGALQNEA